jgi:hypothetical protein
MSYWLWAWALNLHRWRPRRWTWQLRLFFGGLADPRPVLWGGRRQDLFYRVVGGEELFFGRDSGLLRAPMEASRVRETFTVLAPRDYGAGRSAAFR